MLYDRIYAAAENIGWNVIGGAHDEKWTNFCLTKHFYYVATFILNVIYKPTFNLLVTHYLSFMPYGYNVLYINVPNDMIFSADGNFKKRYAYAASADAYIDIYSILHNENIYLKKALAKNNNSSAPIIPMYLAQNILEYSPATKNQALVVGSLWGCNRGSIRVQDALRALGEDNNLVAYGLKSQLSILGKAYKGQIESSHPDTTDNYKKLINLQKEYGISLVFHNFEHLVDGIPTSRIMESVASGAIVISDYHPFIQKFFGDNVLYVNTFESGDAIYQEVKKHMEWIRSNPQEAESKARKAYDIFAENFALETLLPKLYELIIRSKTQ
jgi:glycosyltransferase involved in cell wall biosynthesis